MQLHYPDGTPFGPLDALDHFKTRLAMAYALSASVASGAYPNDDGEEQLIGAMYAIEEDFEELYEAVVEWFDRIPADERPDIGGWGSDRALQPRRSGAAETEVAHG